MEKNKEVINNKMLTQDKNQMNKPLSNLIMREIGHKLHKIRNYNREITNKIKHVKKIIRSYFLQCSANKCEDLDKKCTSLGKWNYPNGPQ